MRNWEYTEWNWGEPLITILEEYSVVYFLLQAYMLNAQMLTEVVHVKNGIVKSFYLQEGNTYRHIGRTISLNGKTYPFYVNLEDNASIRKFINPKDTMGYKQFYNEDFALDAQRVFINMI